MKYISNLLVVVAVLCLALLTSTLLFAQAWSTAQKDVWKTVEAHWKVEAQGDLEGFLSYIHPDFRGWSYQRPTARRQSFGQEMGWSPHAKGKDPAPRTQARFHSNLRRCCSRALLLY